MTTGRQSVHGIILLAGALITGVAGLQHPLLMGDGASQLGAIAAMPSWRLVHWSIAFGYVLVVAGLTGVWTQLAATSGAAAARTGMFISMFGYLTDLVGVMFMLGAGSALADAYRAGDPGLAATHAVFVFDMLHPSARAALRIGAFAVSVGLVGFGWGILQGGGFPRWLGWLGVAGGALGTIVALALPASSNYVVAGVGIATVWQVAAGVSLFRRASRLRQAAPVSDV